MKRTGWVVAIGTVTLGAIALYIMNDVFPVTQDNMG